MCEIMEDLVKEVTPIIKAEGKAEGRAEGNRDTVRRLLAEGITDFKWIAKIADCPLAEVERIARKFQA